MTLAWCRVEEAEHEAVESIKAGDVRRTRLHPDTQVTHQGEHVIKGSALCALMLEAPHADICSAKKRCMVYEPSTFGYFHT